MGCYRTSYYDQYRVRAILGVFLPYLLSLLSLKACFWGEIVVSYPKTILPRYVLLLNTCLG